MDKPSRPESVVQPPKREAFPVARNPTTSLTIAELQKRCDALTREHEEIRRERDELARKLSAASAVAPHSAAQVEQAQKAILSIRQARDSVLAQNQTLMAQLAGAKEQLIDLAVEKEDIDSHRNAAVQQAQASKLECEELRGQVRELTGERSASATGNGDSSLLAAAAQQQVAALIAERDAARAAVTELRAERELQRNQPPPAERVLAELQDARHRLADLEAQTEGFRAQQKKNLATLTRHVDAEREVMQTTFNEEKSVLEAQVATLRTQLDLKNNPAPELRIAEGGRAPASERADNQHLEVVELTEQLEAARTEIGDLRAVLDGLRGWSDVPISSGPTDSGPPVPVPDAEPAEVINYDASITLGAMSSCLQMLNQHPTSVELLEELDNHLEAFSERAQAAGLAAIHRFSSACGELTRRLRKLPAKISPSALQPLEEAVELLTVLTGIRNAGRIPDPADALIYAVDDDPDNCECIAMAFEKMRLRTKYSVRPEVALTELSAHPCDLIILDVDMPRMDGFELSARIRTVAHHATTPILFVSALTSTQERLNPNPESANAFIAKHYHLNELGLRALGLILKARVNALHT